MKLNFDRILIVDAHPDDGEISAGGMIIRLKRENPNCKIWTVYFAPCIEDSRNTGHLEDHKRACYVLGITRIFSFEYARDRLEEHKQNIRDQLWQIREKIHPDLVLCPSPHDFHQDHKTIGEICMTIFRDTSSIWGYEVLRSITPDFRPVMFITLSINDVMTKMKMIKEYKSQLRGRPYFFDVNVFKSHMRMRGTQARVEFAEAFEVLWARY
jgi:LmbE family N-acetylglucosaminyl deacetylase